MCLRNHSEIPMLSNGVLPMGPSVGGGFCLRGQKSSSQLLFFPSEMAADTFASTLISCNYVKLRRMSSLWGCCFKVCLGKLKPSFSGIKSWKSIKICTINISDIS